MYRAAEAAPLLEASGPPLSPDLRARWKLDAANAVALRHPDNARQLLVEALALAGHAGDPVLICRIHWRLGVLAAKFDDSEAHYRTALAAAAGDPYLRAGALLNLGYNRLRANRFDEAIAFLSQALEPARSCGAKALTANISGNLGWCYYRMGDIERAMQLFTAAASLTQVVGDIDDQQAWLVDMGNVCRLRGDLARAADFQQRAAMLARAAGDDQAVAVAWANLADIALDRGDLAAAEDFNQQALAVKRRLGDLQSLAYSELIAAKIEARAQHHAAAETAYQAVIQRARTVDVPDVLWDAYGALASLDRETGRPQQAEVQYRNAIGAIDREWQKLASDESKATFLAPHLIRFFQDYVDFLIERGQPEKALEMAESSRARVLNQRLERLREVPAAFRLAQLERAAKASHTVILSYWLAPRRSSLWVIGAGRCSRFDLPPANEIAALVSKYMDTILAGGDPLARHDPAAAALYQAVLAPAHKLVPPDANVIVAPDGALDQLNFETLVVPTPQPHYWIEDAAVATAPSLRALSGEFHAPARASKLLLLGDPLPASPEFPPLPNAASEVRAVEAHFPPPARAVYTGAAAFPARYAAAAPAAFTNIHFTAHATANRDSPLNSAIILSRQGENFKLYARDVAAVPLAADLVTISACRSAGAKAYSGEGLMGFAWAFLQAGARHVIAGLWDVDDAASVRIMERLYAETAAGQTPARALRAAKLDLIRAGGRNRPPYYWGALEVFTRGLQ